MMPSRPFRRPTTRGCGQNYIIGSDGVWIGALSDRDPVADDAIEAVRGVFLGHGPFEDDIDRAGVIEALEEDLADVSKLGWEDSPVALNKYLPRKCV